MNPDERQTGIEVQLTGTDGNVFALLGTCTRVLKRAGFQQHAAELTDRVTAAESYNQALGIMSEYLDVS